MFSSILLNKQFPFLKSNTVLHSRLKIFCCNYLYAELSCEMEPKVSSEHCMACRIASEALMWQNLCSESDCQPGFWGHAIAKVHHSHLESKVGGRGRILRCEQGLAEKIWNHSIAFLRGWIWVGLLSRLKDGSTKTTPWCLTQSLLNKVQYRYVSGLVQNSRKDSAKSSKLVSTASVVHFSPVNVETICEIHRHVWTK